MNSRVLIGGKKIQEDYLASFVAEKKIPKYFISSYPENFRIKDARELKRTITFAIPQGSFRVFIIPEDITADAQNALLKTIEELDDKTFVFFLARSKESLLNTVISRSKVVILQSTDQKKQDNECDEFISSLGNISSDEMLKMSLQFCERFDNKSTKEDLDALLLSLRDIIVRHFSDDFLKIKNIEKIVKIEDSLQKIYPLLLENNVNKKMALENIFLLP